MENPNITDPSLTPNLGDGGAAVSQDVSNLTLEEINSQLGKDYSTKEAALKSIKDTFSYVGKKLETPEAVIDPNKFVSRDEFNQEKFYSDNPQFKPYKNVISKLGSDPAKVVEDPEFKQILDNANRFQEIETSRSVLHSNPRLGKASDGITEAREAVKNGDYNAANNKAVESVIDAFGMR